MTRFVVGMLLSLAVGGAVGCGRTSPDLQGQGLAVSVRTVDNTADVGEYSSVGLDDVGTPHIAYYDLSNQDLKYAHLDQISGDWIRETLDRAGDVGSYASLAIEPRTSKPHIAYYDATNNRLKYAWQDETEKWHIQTIGENKSDPTNPFVAAGGLYISLKLDNRGKSHIAYVATPDEANLAYRAMYAVYDPVAQVATAFSVGDRAVYVDHGVDYRGGMKLLLRPVGAELRPVILTYRADLRYGVLRLLYYQPEDPAAIAAGPMKGWVEATRGQGLPLVGTYNPDELRNRTDFGRFVDAVLEHPQNAAQVGDSVHISFFDGRRGDLMYLRYGLGVSSTVVPMTVDKLGIVGEGTSIVLLPEKNVQSGTRPRVPVIAYYDATNNDLKLAFQMYDSQALLLLDEWRTTQVDLPLMVGDLPSMVLLNPSQVGIGYYDKSKRSLKFAVVDVSF